MLRAARCCCRCRNVNKLLIGNKCDLPHDERCVTTQEAEALAAQ